jgi:cholesterol transport system auxiliary component
MFGTGKIARVVSLALVISSSACVLGPSETGVPRSYFLNPEISWKNPHGSGERIGTAVLLVTQPKAQAGFDTERMAFLLRPFEINYFAYNQWADSPPSMLHRVIVDNLDKTGRWHAVLQSATAPANYRLDSDNLILEQQFFTQPSRVHLVLRAQLIETKTQSILASETFEVFELAPSDDAYGGVVAANHAVEKLLSEMAAWLDTIPKATK